VTEAFDLDWLDLREPFDALARNEALAARFLARLPARPRLLDLGAGTGSLFRWLAPRIGRAQAWTLVDADREMAEAAFDTVADRAEAVGLRVTFPSRRCLLVHAPGGAWRVEALVADLAEAPDNLPLHEADAVVNSALCDLVSRPWIERMAAALRVPFYAALCVDGRDRFSPPHPADAAVAQGFRRDQRRNKGFGGRRWARKRRRPWRKRSGAGLRGGNGGERLGGARPAAAAPGLPLDAARRSFRASSPGARRRRWRPGRPGRPARFGVGRSAPGAIARRGLAARIGHRDVLAVPPGPLTQSSSRSCRLARCLPAPPESRAGRRRRFQGGSAAAAGGARRRRSLRPARPRAGAAARP
jgi:SAM-dependent methyltransferase